MTSDTVKQADYIRHLWAAGEMIQAFRLKLTRAFYGAVIRKIAEQFPQGYQDTEHVHLLSSLIPAFSPVIRVYHWITATLAVCR